METYKCIKCLEFKNRTFKYKDSHHIKHYLDENDKIISGNVCHKCNLKRQSNIRKYSENRYSKKYEKTINGFLMRTYRNMLSRVSGIQYKKSHLYLGKSILSKNDFYLWSKNSNEFRELFLNWKNENYNRKITPSIDRIDSSKGYSLDNIRWLTHSENSRLGSLKNKNY